MCDFFYILVEFNYGFYYFELGFSPIDETLIKNVCKVSPGEKISYNFSNSTINKNYFFKLDYKENSKKIININEVQDDLTKAIKKKPAKL